VNGTSSTDSVAATVPFTALEETVFHIERKHTPWNIQIEVETSERADVDRLHDAAVTACNSHPFARAQRREHRGSDTDLLWEIPDEVDTVPVSVSVVENAKELAEARTRFYADGFDLTDGVPFRMMVAREPHRNRNRLLACVSHVPCDGIGALRLVRSTCQAYRGEAVDADPVEFEASREVLEEVRPSSLLGKIEKIGNAAGHLTNTVDSPDRVAEKGAVAEDDLLGRGNGDKCRWGFVHESLNGLTDDVVRNRPDGVSVNDVLLATLHTTIEDWNQHHDDPADKISLMMPVNLRPRDWFYDVVGMYALFQSISTKASDRGSFKSTVREVARQTTEVKEKDTAVSFLQSLRLIPSETPVGLRGQMPELLKGPGSGLVDTAVLSNLGRVPEPAPALAEEDDLNALWFSPPCQSPADLSLGVVTAGGVIRLVFRHKFSVLGREAAREFAEMYVGNLEEAVGE